MLLASLLFALSVFAFAMCLVYRKAENKRARDERIKELKGAARSDREKKRTSVSIKEIKEKITRRKSAKLRERQINSTKNTKKQSATDAQLQMAGIPLNGVQFTLVKTGLSAALFAAPLLLGKAFSLDDQLSVLIGCAGAICGLLLPQKLVRSRIAKQQSAYRDALPDIMDLLVVSVEAGLGFDASIIRLYEKDKSPLMQELMRAIQDVQRGMSKKEAYSNMSKRCGVKELTSFLNSLIQAEQLGISIKSVLKTQSEALREGRRQRAEEKSMKAPVKMLVPLVLFIFPVIFIVLLGPAAMNVLEVMG